MTQRYSRSPRLPYANGGPRNPADNNTLGDKMTNLIWACTKSVPGAIFTPRARARLYACAAFAAFNGCGLNRDRFERWGSYAFRVARMLQQPSRYDWWESGDPTPTLSRSWGLR